MKRFTLLITLLLLLVAAFPAHMQDSAPDEPVVVADSHILHLTSTVNGQDYRLSIALPEGYASSDKSYPVLYLLDPAITFLTTTQVVRYLSWAKALPDLIVVGIGYPSDSADVVDSLRERDYYNQQDKFLQVIDQEVIPLIDSTYRTDTTDRALVGFSYGGEFVFYTLVNQPALFRRYIAIDSPAGALMPYLMRNDPDFRNSFVGRDDRLFIAVEGTEVLSAAINARSYDGLKATGLSLGNTTHEQALVLSLPAGIIAIYAP